MNINKRTTTESETVSISYKHAEADFGDLVHVVRCKDCDNWKCNGKHGAVEVGSCEEWSDAEDGMTRYTKETDFCSYAEKNEDRTD